MGFCTKFRLLFFLTESSFIIFHQGASSASPSSFLPSSFHLNLALLNRADSIGHSRLQSFEPSSNILNSLRTFGTGRRFHFCRVQRGQDRDRRRVGLPTCTALRWTLLPATDELCNNLAR